jgi:O-6-methylguanine DNA methyltransferase
MKLTEQLRNLAVTAPPGFTDRVLASLGLADHWVVVDGAPGRLHVAFNERGVAFVRLGLDDDAFRLAFRNRFGRPLRDEPDASASSELWAALRHGDAADLPVDLRGLTSFQTDVLSVTRTIPRGEVRSYAAVAASVGRPRAVRAVGTALGNNPVPLVIPCHRVVRSDGTTGDYAFGAEVKAALLQAERAA